MDLDFSEEQDMLRTMARDFLEKECPKTLVRELEEDEEKGYSPELWRKMAELGWMGLILPEKYGGAEMEFMDLIILLEEMGRNIVPGPFFSTVVLCSNAIFDAGTDAQKDELLTKIANGDTIMAFALTEPSATYAASGVATTAKAEGNNYVIKGTKLFISDAAVADQMIVAARTKAGTGEDGITLFLVDAKSPGIEITKLKTIAMDKQCEVVFKDVKVPKANVLGEVDKGWPVVKRVLEKATAAKCAEMVGGCQAVLDMTVAYAKERVQYGRPIGGFQVVQHFLADMWIKLNTSRNLMYEAAWRAGEGLDCTREVAAAKGWCNQCYHFIGERGVQIHGAIGITRDHDAGLYYRRAKASDLMLGDSDFQREVVACEMGL